MDVQRPGHAGKEGPGDERHYAMMSRINSHRRRGDFIIPHGLDRPALGRAAQAGR